MVYNEIDSIPQGNDNDHFNAESDLKESLLNRDTSMVSSPKIDSLLKEFSGELAHIDSLPPGTGEADFDPDDDIRLVEKLLYDNSSPRPPEELNYEIPDAIIESFSPSPIPVEDSDSLILFLINDTILSLPPKVFLNHDRSLSDINDLKIMVKVFDLGIYKKNSSPTYVEALTCDDRALSFASHMLPEFFVPYFTLSTDCPDYEDSRAHGFFHRSLDLLSFACLFMGIRYAKSC
ncbi:hypothetical protein Tco_0541376 [Tanacetum coccineum]